MASHAPANYICLFFLIVRGIENRFVITRPCDVIYRSAATIAFVSSNQIPSKGANALIIPTAHYKRLYYTENTMLVLDDYMVQQTSKV